MTDRPIPAEAAAERADDAFDDAFDDTFDDGGIAIVGMACRYPGAADVGELWENLKKGVDGISRFTVPELLAAGVAESDVRHPDYVPARGVLPHADRFDWSLFGYSPGEATRMDPQQRVFLETSFTALQDAGLDTRRPDVWIGVFAGCDTPRADFADDDRLDTEKLARDKDFMATRVAYKLGLRGPAITIQTACSTSLVATHLAVQSLLGHDCDVALAGGASLRLPANTGYRYKEGGIASPDGYCRPFDADANGTVPGSGVGVVVLKRLADAVRDGDRIVAVIRGSAVNNDGSEKIGYSTPSVPGQRDVIALAHEQAGAVSDDIGYVEAHGTGTAVGDPVELAGLTAAFAATASGEARAERCRIGAIKSNIGHTGAAAGVAGLIKTALMLQHRTLVPNAHVTAPAEALADSPFQVCAESGPWPGEGPLLAGVSSFGLGGTNAHLVLESPPAPPRRDPEPEVPRLLCLSAPTEAGLDLLRTRLAEQLAPEREAPRLDDTAWTLATARRHFPLRRAHVVADRAEAEEVLRGAATAVRAPDDPRRSGVVLTMPGQSGLKPGAGRAAHALLPRYREVFDRVREESLDRFGIDIARVMDPDTSPDWLTDTRNQQVVQLAQGYAFAEQLAAWDIRPTALLGNSSGEYVAALLAGVWDLSDALGLVHTRGEAMFASPEGRMLAVSLSVEEAAPLVAAHEGVGLAVDSPGNVVISGRVDAAEAFAATLTRRDVKFTVLRSPLASHSDVMAGAADVMRAALAKVTARAPGIPVISNLTGSWLTAEQAADPEYWAAHLCTTVRLTEGIGTLLDGPSGLFVELGPGDSMTRYVRSHPAWGEGRTAVPTIGRAPARERQSLLETVGRLWEHGLQPVWNDLFPDSAPRRTALPPVPLDSRPLPMRPTRTTAPTAVATAPTGSGPLLSRRRWTRDDTPAAAPAHDAVFLVRDRPDTGACLLADALCAPDVRSTRTDWTQVGADGVPTGLDTAPANAVVVAVLPPAEGPHLPEPVLRLAERTRERGIPLLLLARGITDVLGNGEATRPDAAELTAWATHQSRTANGLLHLLDLGPTETPAPSTWPQLHPSTPLFAWRGRYWWALARERVEAEEAWNAGIGGNDGNGRGVGGTGSAEAAGTAVSAPPATPLTGRLAVGVAELPGAVGLVRELAVGGAEVGVVVGDGGGPLPVHAVAAGAAWESGERLSAKAGLRADLDRYCAGLVGRFLLSAGGVAPGDLVSDGELRRRLDPQTRLPRYVGMLIGVLAAEGWLTGGPDTAWQLSADFADRATEALLAGDALDEVSGLRGLLDVCVGALPEVFAGRRTPVSVLYPDARPELMREHLRANDVVVGDALACLDTLVETIRGLPVGADRPLSILEVGAGQAGFAQRLLDGWDARDHVSYHVTDVSPLLVRRARERYAGARNMTFSSFDFTRDAVAQGLVPGGYDLVLAYNSLHVAPDVRRAGRRLRDLLTDTGALCLVEITRTDRWEHLVWGLAPGWWDFEDDLRADSVHLDRATWRTALRDSGFGEVTALPVDDLADLADHTVLLASRSDPPRGPVGAGVVRELAARAGQHGCGTLIHLVGPGAVAREEQAVALAAALRGAPGDRPTLVVTVDDDHDPAPERWRRLLDPGADGAWRHVEVPRLDAATLATLPALAGAGSLPPVVRLERPATPAAPPAPTAARPVPGALGDVASESGGGGGGGGSRPGSGGAAQGDPATAALGEVWQDLLGVPATRARDDFFALGGDSLMAVHFISRVRDRTGVSLPLTAFAETATFGDLSALLRAAGATSTAAPAAPVDVAPERSASAAVPREPAVPGLMVLRGTGSRTPLFLAAPAVGSSLCYRTLARQLGDDQPCYGIESPLLDDTLSAGARIEDIAAHHVDIVRRARPEGPYRVGGWSVGAMVAHEMARQLIAAGEVVESVLGIDGYVIDTHGRPQFTLPELLVQGVRQQVQAALGRRPDLQRMGGDQRVYRRAFQRNVRAMLRYTPRPIPCDVVIFRAGEADDAALERVRRRIGGLYEGTADIRAVPGTHFTVLNDPYVGEVAAGIRELSS
ncbi:type I polyketide synthase [Streptomyces sp. NPDC087212]|uniref:type I polyketide synthase n=1 Tax=Streptomyces sp. NPDC087212 TaxID=3365766 RepID=UPI003803EDF7